MKIFARLSLFTLSGIFLVGCAAPPNSGPRKPMPTVSPAATQVRQPMEIQPPTPPDAAAIEPSSSEKNLALALASFDHGAYSTAMKQLLPLTTDNALKTPDRLKAIKTLAFAQCLTRATLACQKSFENAFKLDPDFDLAPAEQGHPLWGRQFLRARQTTKTK